MTPGVKYTLGRVGIFIVCAVPAVLLLPKSINELVRLMIALVVSAIASYFLLARWRADVAESLSEHSQRRVADKTRLRSALAREEIPADEPHR